MRIISQGGTIDVPYEKFVFAMTVDNYIVAVRDTIARTDEIAKGVVAKYSTKSKARKAMEMLRKAYAGLPIIMQNIEITDDVPEMFKEWQKQGIFVRTEDNQPSKVEFLNNGYFRFPADDEVED